jgi:hypothetical protein
MMENGKMTNVTYKECIQELMETGLKESGITIN